MTKVYFEGSTGIFHELSNDEATDEWYKDLVFDVPDNIWWDYQFAQNEIYSIRQKLFELGKDHI